MTEATKGKAGLFHNKWTMVVLLSAGLAMDLSGPGSPQFRVPHAQKRSGDEQHPDRLTATPFLWTYALFSPLARFSRRPLFEAHGFDLPVSPAGTW